MMNQNSKRPWIKHYSEEALSYDPDKMRYESLSDLFFDVGEKFAKHSAFTIVLPNGVSVSISYEEYNTYSNYFASYLREVIGLKKGDVIALQTPNCLGYPVAAAGIIKSGCVLTSLNPLYTPSEMKYQLNDCNVKILVIIDIFGYKIDEIIDDTKVEKVILLSLFDFMPTLKRVFFNAIFKYIKKGIPKIITPTVYFAEALKIGEQTIHDLGINVKSYSDKVKSDDHAIYQYTGGTTGRSKGAILTHRNLLSNIEQVRIMLGSSFNENEKGNTLTILPLYHIYAFTLNMLVNITYGWGNILIPNPRPIENLKPVFKNYKITWMTGVNTLFVALLNADWFTSKISFSAAGGAALQVSVAKEWAEKHGVIVEGYGLSETSPVLSFNSPNGMIRVGTVGIPMPGVDLKFVDDNDNEVSYGEVAELCVRGPNVTKGYLKESEEIGIAIKDGWFHTGDIAVLDDEGFIKIIDRKKDLILVSGFSVYPNELESVISGFDGVIDVAVIGVKDSKSGEVPKAYIMLSDKSLTEEKIIKMCQKEMISYKVPKYIKFVDDLPKTPVGKVLRRNLSQLD